MIMNNRRYDQIFMAGKYSVSSFNKVIIWPPRLHPMNYATKLQFDSVIPKRFLPVVWVVLYIVLCMTKANAQRKIGVYEGLAWQNVLPGIRTFHTQAFGHDLVRPYFYQPDNIQLTEKRYTGLIHGQLQNEYIPHLLFNHKSNERTRVIPATDDDGKGNRNNKADERRYQLLKMTGRIADMNKSLKIAAGALVLIIIILLLQLYRVRLNNKRSLQARQRELDQKNIFIETLNSSQDKLVKEKEWLLKEVQHRVKNSLQVVISLLYSQSLYLEDGAAIQAIKDSLRRMQAMSLIHQKLYQDNNTSTISMPEYIDDLVAYLHESFDVDNHIVFERAVEPIELDVSQVLPLGLIFTEGIVNAIKYAFLKGQQGIVRLYLGYDGPEHLLLKISDNGIGLPAGMDAMEHNSLGLDLIQGLSKQLKGSFRIENNNGVKITVRFAV